MGRKYKFVVPEAIAQECPEIPSLVAPTSPPSGYPYRLICIRKADRFNSQLGNLSWILAGQGPDEILLGEELARLKRIASGNRVIVYNQWGEVIVKAKVCRELPEAALICSARQDLHGQSINNLISARETDMGKITNEISDVAFHDTFVNIVRW